MLLAMNFMQADTYEFRVNMTVQAAKGNFVPATDIVTIRSMFNGWYPGDTMSDGNSDLIYTKTYSFTPGDSTYFKFAYHDASYDSVVWENMNNRFYVYPPGGAVYEDYFEKDSGSPPPVQSCPSNILQNGGFTTGMSSWSAAYGSPDFNWTPACGDSGFIAMWGNQFVGEALQQNVAFTAGNTYTISFCGRWAQESNRPYPPRYRFSASNTQLTGPQDVNGTEIGLSELFNIPGTWVNSVPLTWTPTQDYSKLTISVTNQSNANHGDSVTYSYIDNVCIVEELSGDTSLIFQGLLHERLGNALLKNYSDTALTIINIGSSGNDGVRITIPDSVRSAAIKYLPRNINVPGGYRKIESRGTLNGVPNSLLGEFSLTYVNIDTFEVRTGFGGSGNDSVGVSVYEDTTFIGSTILLPLEEGKIGYLTIPSPESGIMKNSMGRMLPMDIQNSKNVMSSFDDIDKTASEVAVKENGVKNLAFHHEINFGGFTGHELVLNSMETSVTEVRLKTVNVYFANINTVTIKDETLEYQQGSQGGDTSVLFKGLLHTRLGEALLLNQGDSTLNVFNLDSSGNDGVRILPPHTLSFDANIGPSYIADLVPPGGFLKFSATGALSDESTQSVGSITFENKGGCPYPPPDCPLLFINADYSPLGATSYSVRAYNGDSLVYSGNGFTNNIGSAFRTPNDLHWKHHPLIDESSSSMIQHGCTFTWGPPVRIDITNGPSVMVSKLVVSPENDSISIDYFTSFEITAKDLDWFYLWDEQIDDYSVSTESLTVATGWNIVSVPVIPADYSKDSLFPTATSAAFTFAGGYQLKTTLSNGVGYWMKFPSAQSIEMEGWRVKAESLTVVEGWNMVGSISERVKAESLTTEPLTMTTSSFFGYDRGYNVTEYIEPGKGYWVKADTAGIIILNSDSIGLTSKNRIRIKPTSELPPPPPEGDGNTSETSNLKPETFALEQAYPNPFNPSTVIRYQLPEKSFVTLKVIDLLGREVAVLLENDVKEAGAYDALFNAAELPTGMYFYRLSARGEDETTWNDVKKMVLLK